MTTPPADPPAEDPDKDLTDEQKAAKSQFKGWAKEAFGEFIAEAREEEEKEAPKRTKKPDNPAPWFQSLFGG